MYREMTVDDAWNKLSDTVACLVCNGHLDEEEGESILDAAMLETSAEGIIHIAAENNLVLGG